jgi:hypothetical protein
MEPSACSRCAIFKLDPNPVTDNTPRQGGTRPGQPPVKRRRRGAFYRRAGTLGGAGAAFWAPIAAYPCSILATLDRIVRQEALDRFAIGRRAPAQRQFSLGTAVLNINEAADS